MKKQLKKKFALRLASTALVAGGLLVSGIAQADTQSSNLFGYSELPSSYLIAGEDKHDHKGMMKKEGMMKKGKMMMMDKKMMMMDEKMKMMDDKMMMMDEKMMKMDKMMMMDK